MADETNVSINTSGLTGLLAPSWSLAAQPARTLAELDLSELAKAPIISAARHPQNRAGSPRAIGVVTGEEIRRRDFRNVPETVASLTGVFLPRSNSLPPTSNLLPRQAWSRE